MEKKMTSAMTGSCLCGACKFEVDVENYKPVFSVYCHCSICRRRSGAPFVHLVGFPPPALRWVEGEEKTTKYLSSEVVSRRSCSICSSPLVNETVGPMSDDFPPFFDVATSTFVHNDLNSKLLTQEGFKASAHIFYTSGILQFKDGLPKFASYGGIEPVPE